MELIGLLSIKTNFYNPYGKDDRTIWQDLFELTYSKNSICQENFPTVPNCRQIFVCMARFV